MLIALLACTEPTPEAQPEPRDTSWPELEQQDPEPLDPAWTASQAGLAFQTALEGPYPQVRDIGATYLEWIARGDPNCPGSEDLQPPAVTLEGCTSESGVHYAGLSSWSEDPSRWGLQVADFRLSDPEGRAFLAGGEAVIEEFGVSRSVLFRGTWHDSGAGGWLGQGGSAILQISASDQGMVADISMETGAGPLYTSQLIFGQDCIEGVVYLQGGEGGWYELDLDCGCGQVVFAGEELGEACLDGEPIRDALEEAL